MQFRTTGLPLLGAMALPVSGTAQTTPAPPATTRTVVAAAKLPTVTDVPLYFKAVSITLQRYEKSGVSAANGILYQMSGSAAVALERRRGAVHRRRKDRRANGGQRRAIYLPPLLPRFRCGVGSACRNGSCRRARIISHSESDPRPEARRL